MARILRDSKAPGMSWWDPVYLYEQLEEEWNKSLQTWISFLQRKPKNRFLKRLNIPDMMAEGGKQN